MRLAGAILVCVLHSLFNTMLASAQVVCSNGLPGFETADVCCPEECGQCGGIDCGDLPGGQENCCTGYIDENGDNCSDTNTAPCIVDDPAFCSNGLSGFENNGVCCSLECGTCGGSVCMDLAGGPETCCTRYILRNGNSCSVTESAPCVIDPATVCSNGYAGYETNGVCCSEVCGACGGSDCRSLPGGEEECCTGYITQNGDVCSETGSAPCIVFIVGAVGDPHILGFHGQTFDFTGEDGEWYAVLKDGLLQVNMRVTAAVPGLAAITYITGMSIISPDLDGVMHTMTVLVGNPETLEAECPIGVSPCLGNGALRVILDGRSVERPGETTLGRQVTFGAVNIPGECRPFGFEKYWGRKVHEAELFAAAGGNRRLDINPVIPMAEWILQDRLATNKPECQSYVNVAQAEGTLLDHQSEHVSFQLATPSFRMRLNYGKLHQLATRDPTDQFDLPDHITHQMNFGLSDVVLGENPLGIMGETAVVRADQQFGQPIMHGLGVISGAEEDYKVDGALGVHFKHDLPQK